RRHTRFSRDWSSDVCSSDLDLPPITYHLPRRLRRRRRRRFMTFGEWIGDPINWVFLVLGVVVLVAAFRVVTSQNVIHAALFLVATLAGAAGLFLLLSA